jgi:hypothetical protein
MGMVQKEVDAPLQQLHPRQLPGPRLLEQQTALQFPECSGATGEWKHVIS